MHVFVLKKILFFTEEKHMVFQIDRIFKIGCIINTEVLQILFSHLFLNFKGEFPSSIVLFPHSLVVSRNCG